MVYKKKKIFFSTIPSSPLTSLGVLKKTLKTKKSQGPILVGSLAGAAHLLNGNAGVLRLAQ